MYYHSKIRKSFLRKRFLPQHHQYSFTKVLCSSENQYTVANEKLFNLPNSDEPKTQKELAESHGITQQTMNNYMRMVNMIPEECFV